MEEPHSRKSFWVRFARSSVWYRTVALAGLIVHYLANVEEGTTDA